MSGPVTTAEEQLGTLLPTSLRCPNGKTLLPSPCLLALFFFSFVEAESYSELIC